MGRSLRAAAIAAVALASARTATAAEHPPLLERKPGCEYWLGGAVGNDKTTRFTVVLCVDAATGAATGHAQWSSLVSGWNVRELTGTVVGDVYTLADVRLVESHPINRWQFCTIDRWDLRRTGDRLEGTYDSAACRDHASVWLERLPDTGSAGSGGSGSGRSASGSGAGPGSRPPAPPASPDKPATRDRGCCAATPAPIALPSVVLLVLALTAASRRRSARDTRPRRRPG